MALAAEAQSEPDRACPLGVCDGSGWILGPEDVARPCRCREDRLRRAQAKGLAAVIPPRYRGVSLDRPPVTDLPDIAVQPVKRFIRELDDKLRDGAGIWFMGDIGTGKTTLAMLVSKQAIDAGHSVAIYSMPKLLARIRQTYQADEDGDSYFRFFERLTSVDLLHIDDVGAEKQTDWVIEQLYALVNERYEKKRSIMFTTNVESGDVDERLREVEEQIGRRTFSRLIEMCGDPILMFGNDYRSLATPSP
jgi:DNA replication protein DnaC